MNGPEIVRYLEERGYLVTRVGPDKIGIEPEPPAAILARIRERKGDIIAHLAEMSYTPATDHKFVLWSGVVKPDYASCLRCGIPPHLHGDDALATAITIDEPNTAVLVAAGVVRARMAESLAEEAR